MTLATNYRGNIETGFRDRTRIGSSIVSCRQNGNKKKNVRTGSAKKASGPKKIITAEVTISSDTNFYRGFAAQGIYVETWETLPVGTRLRVKIAIEDLDEKFEVDGQVRLIKTEDGIEDDLNSGMGIEFLWLTPSQQKTICRFWNIREPIFYDY